MAEFGPAVMVTRQLEAIYEVFPQLRRSTGEVPAEEVCRRMLQLGVEPDPEHLFHATHVLYHRVAGRPFFDNYREQQYSEAMYHLEYGQKEEAQERFKRIIEHCDNQEDSQLLDHDREAFRKRIEYLRHDVKDLSEADRIEDLRRRLIGRGACESFLMTAEQLIKGEQPQYAQSYINWVRERGTDKQQERARVLSTAPVLALGDGG